MIIIQFFLFINVLSRGLKFQENDTPQAIDTLQTVSILFVRQRDTSNEYECTINFGCI